MEKSKSFSSLEKKIVGEPNFTIFIYSHRVPGVAIPAKKFVFWSWNMEMRYALQANLNVFRICRTGTSL